MKLHPTSSTLTARELKAALRHGVACVGTLAEISQDDFVELVERHGGTYISYSHHARIPTIVVGDAGLPVTPAGDLIDMTGRTILGERQFLDLLGESIEHHFYTPKMLAEILQVTPQRIHAWVRAGLIKPVRTAAGIMHFDFRQVSLARTLCDLTEAGVSVAKIRRNLQVLLQRLPDLAEPLQQLAVIESNGPLLVRLEEGDLSDVDGQLQLNFTGNADNAPIPLHRIAEPTSAHDWHEQGIEQEASGLFEEAERCYRQALLLAGPDPQICFDLASVLAAQGRTPEAIERYRQVVELEPARSDAWNNLGVLLSNAGQLDQALESFTQAIHHDRQNAGAYYNFADTAEQLGRLTEAREHWQKFLQLEPYGTAQSDFAKSRLASYSA